MKKLITTIKAAALTFLFFAAHQAAYAQWTGTTPFNSGELAARLGPVAVGTTVLPAVPPGPDLKLYVVQNFGQLSTGTFGSVTSSNSQWTSIGLGPSIVPQFYGTRTQDGTLALLTGTDNGNQPTITWTDQNGTTSTSTSELRFSFIGSDNVVQNFGRWDARGNLFLGNLGGSISDNFYRLYVGGFENSTGIRGQAIDVNAGSTSFNFGLFSLTSGATTSNTAILARASSSASTVTGVEASATGGTTNYGVFASGSGGTNNFAGFFSGNVTVTGTFTHTSDARLKNILSDEDARTGKPSVLEMLRGLEAYDYTYKNEGTFARMNLPQGKQHGFMAQEVQEVFPELVEKIVFMHHDENAASGKGDPSKTEKVEYLGVNYVGMIPYLAEAIKELDTKQQENERLQQKLNALESEMAEMRKQMEELSGTSQAQPEQSKARVFGNSPNPFNTETIIGYELPTNARATLLVYDMNGKQIMSFDNLKTGKGEVTIRANALEAGMYMYTLIADGKEVDTRRMILTR